MIVAALTVLVAFLGLTVGLRGNLFHLAAGLGLTCLVAIVQYIAIHRTGDGSGSLPAWPWGASSLVAYVFGIVIGAVLDHGA